MISLIHPMTLESIGRTAGQLGGTLSRAGEPIRLAATEACHAVRDETGQAISRAAGSIRKNPLSFMIGAVAFGVAVGCLIMSGRHTPTARERYITGPLDHAGNALASSLHRLHGNLKFW